MGQPQFIKTFAAIVQAKGKPERMQGVRLKSMLRCCESEVIFSRILQQLVMDADGFAQELSARDLNGSTDN